MGRIRGKTIRQTVIEILRTHKDSFNDNFESNKKILSDLITTEKAIRNKIAGYITKLAKEKKIEEFIIEHSTK
ncbi:MAG: 30S ribosomal protein S17e [Candidatus Parvarchaeota archaeon]|nr:30S ribosomal protein S17e [Candidatus Parvarchaeota archaeon]